MTPQQAFDRYEQIRPRLPMSVTKGSAREIAGLQDIAPEADAFVFDAYGVLNVGEKPIPGAHEKIQQLRREGKSLLVLTNAASFNRQQTVDKFARLGFEFHPEEIISSRDVCISHLKGFDSKTVFGVMAPTDFDPADLSWASVTLTDDIDAYDRVDAFLFLSSAAWTTHRQDLLQASLRRNPRPVVVGNPDLVAPRETGLTLEPGFFAHELMDQFMLSVTFHGKPFETVYKEVETRLKGVARDRIVMVGDTLHTDVLGAQAQGWKTALITDHGLFAGQDVRPYIVKCDIVPDWIAPSI